jgi:hypothetical protein
MTISYRKSYPLTWARTVIGGETLNHDFVVMARGVTIGRIKVIAKGLNEGRWGWSFLLGHIDFRYRGMDGDAATKQEAANLVKLWFQEYLETPPLHGGGLGLEPEEWPPDERSMQLRILRVNNPDLHIKIIEGLRAGTIERHLGTGANFS